MSSSVWWYAGMVVHHAIVPSSLLDYVSMPRRVELWYGNEAGHSAWGWIDSHGFPRGTTTN